MKENAIYLAAPWFTPEQEDLYDHVVAVLRAVFGSHAVYVPREHAIENGDNLPNHTWGQMVFIDDYEAIRKCDFVYAIDWGFTADSGTAWEVGAAYALGKSINIIKPDVVDVQSLMLLGSCRHVYNECFNELLSHELKWK